MLKRVTMATLLFAAGISFVRAEELRPPLEKQFFDYFATQCQSALETQARSQGKNLEQGNLASGIKSYCACTSQTIVSYLSASEIISFATNPEAEPAASKITPYFNKCQGK